MPLGSIAPALAPGTAEYPVITSCTSRGRSASDDVYDNFYPQCSSQWDSLAHVAYRPDELYNGAYQSRTCCLAAGTRLTTGRGTGSPYRAIVLDVERAMRAAGRHYHPGESIALGVEEA